MSNNNENAQYAHIGNVNNPFFESVLGDASEIIFCEGQKTYTFVNNAPVHVDYEFTKMAESLNLSEGVYDDFVESGKSVKIFEFDTDNAAYLGVYFYEAGKVCALFRKNPTTYVETENDFHISEVAELAFV